MAKLKTLLKRLDKNLGEYVELTSELTAEMVSVLGDGWHIDTNIVDGVVVVDPNNNNFAPAFETLVDALENMPAEKAIETIQKYPCD
ncbi:hypothetical protein [Neptuniibacter sp. QD37_11]|uniref:hypothetical protein n=1 Tax=Neptuniibacter sp. QD37_11 TaxID=3398209 RepID=UPI0039F63DFF